MYKIPNATSIAARAVLLESHARTAFLDSNAKILAPVQARRQEATIKKKRFIHTTQVKDGIDTSVSRAIGPEFSSLRPAHRAISDSALDCLPLAQILRTYIITALSSSPALLGPSISLLRRMLESKSLLFSLEKNPLMRAILLETFYKQFCAGENEAQVVKSVQDLRSKGYAGVILEYALEVLKDAEGNEVKDVEVWRQGLLDTIRMSAEGDFVGLKWSGMGPASMRRMAAREAPSERMKEAMDVVCSAAAAKNISLLPAAEESWTLDGFFDWCQMLQRSHNTKGKSVVYGTYQAYLKQTPATLSRHLENARQNGYTLGVKLVRGAYLGSEKRDLIYPDIEGTHAAYDSIASALIHRRYNDILRPSDSTMGEDWPDVNVVLATHNSDSVRKAQGLRRAQQARGEDLTTLCFAQLQGMADEVSCSLIEAAKDAEAEGRGTFQERVFKCTTWGSMYECLNYLLRRAAENKDAASRTSITRAAMGAELRRRARWIIRSA